MNYFVGEQLSELDGEFISFNERNLMVIGGVWGLAGGIRQ